MGLSKIKIIISSIVLVEVIAGYTAYGQICNSKNTDVSIMYSTAANRDEWTTKEINFSNLTFKALVDIPKSWEGYYYFKQDSYYYNIPSVNGTGEDMKLAKCIIAMFKDKETGYEFPLFTIEQKHREDLSQLYLNDIIMKNINGKEYVIGGPTGGFDEPASALKKYKEMRKDYIEVMKSVR